MRKLLLMSLVCFVFGCSSIEDIKENYLDSYSPEKPTFSEAMTTLKNEYLKASPNATVLHKNAEIIAYHAILQTSFKDGYDVLRPKVDKKLGMPQMTPYMFLHFQPKKERDDLRDTVYLVVIKIMDKKIVYQGVYRLPGGDHFYRYNDIINKIEKK